MGKFKDVGDPAIVLMEEMAEAIQVISKKIRFTGTEDKGWYTKREGLDDCRWEELQAEMADVFYQWFRLKEQIIGKPPIQLDGWWECTEGRLHEPNENCDCQDFSSFL